MPKTLSELLTRRELYYARLIAEGCSNREIARRARVSAGYIGNRLSLIYAKLGFGMDRGSSSFDPRILLAIRYDRELGRAPEGGEQC